MSIGQVLGTVAAVLLLGVLLFNGLVMLISPARWFRLPSYIPGQGSLRQRDYLGKFSDRIQIRILGLAFVGVPLYLLSDSLGITPRFLSAMGSAIDALILRSGRWLSFITCLGVIGCGFVMLFRPKWWVMKYMSTGETDDSRCALLDCRPDTS